MNMGAERAEAQPQGDGEWESSDASAPTVESFDFHNRIEEEDATERSLRHTLLGGVLLVAAAGWLAFAGWTLSRAWPVADNAAWMGWAATISAPLILIALLWLIFGRSPRRETERFVEAVGAMRRESQALESVLTIVDARLRDHRAVLSDEAARLMALGDEASDRLGRATQAIARETAEIDRTAQALDSAAAAAKVDIGVLLADLPKAEQQARAAAESIRAAGLGAHEQAAALEGQLASLTARGREADEAVGGAAQRLGAQVARIESSAGAAVERMDQAAVSMNSAVDGAMARAAESVEQARAGLEAQGQAILAAIEQSRAAFAQAGAEAGREMIERLESAGASVTALAARISEQDSASDALVNRLSTQLGELDGQLGALGRTGEEQNARLTQSLGALRGVVQALRGEVELGSTESGALIDRSHELAEALNAVTMQLRETVPAALSEVESQAERAGAAALAVVSPAEAAQASAALAALSLAESEESIQRQREALDALIAAVQGGVAEAQVKLGELGAAVGETERAQARLVQETGPALIEALVRVRDAANQAANHAREAIVAAIPDSLAALTEAAREALDEATAEPVHDQLAEIAGASQRAMAVARQASERLTRQLLTMSETAAAIEDRIAEDQAAREEKDSDALTRRVSLLIEALNSTAIDVNKLLSNEVADTAWAAYLKGDRGVFTRRAVRLLDSGEARAVQRQYADEPDFRDQVNRYVHDFEAMLRRILADREGSTLAVTLLSSDMGKLYVALAQAIERLRR